MTTNRTRLSEQPPGQQNPPIADLIDHLSRFDGPPQQFLEHLLAVQCVISWASAGAILRAGANGQAEVLAVYPPMGDPNSAPAWLAQAVEFLPQLGASAKATVRPLRTPDELYGQPADKFLVLVPVRGGAGIRGMGAFVIETSDAQMLQACCQRLELTLSLLSLYEMRLTLQRRQSDLQRLRVAMETLSAVNEPEKLAGVAMAMCNEAASRWQCHRVSLGFLKGRYVQLCALSHTEKFSRKMKLVQDIEAAMEECLDQDLEVVFPPADGATYVCRASGDLSRMQGPAALVSLPLRRRGEVVGVLTLERPLDKPFTLEEVEALRLTCDLSTARLANLYENDRWFGARVMLSARKNVATILGPKHTWIKLIVIAVFGLCMLLIFGQGKNQAEGTCVLEATERKVLPAPYDGYLQMVFKEPGDSVIAGETVLAKLRTDDLQGELIKANQEFATYDAQARAAQAAAQTDSKKLSEFQQAKAQMKKASEQVALLEYKLSQADIKSPITGVIAVGDLKPKLNAPVRTGDALFEISPLESLRATVYIPEDQIADVRENMTGELATAAHPGDRIPFKVERINPVAELVNQKNVFKVRVVFDGVDINSHGLRPGSEGVAKVDIDHRSFGELWSRKLINWVRMKLWI